MRLIKRILNSEPKNTKNFLGLLFRAFLFKINLRAFASSHLKSFLAILRPPHFPLSTLFIWLLLLIIFPLSAQHKKREMRGVWVATVSNLDWPNKKGDTEAQKKELLQLLDSLHTLNINAVIFQIRPSADAFYQSSFEPWSAYLTGTQGKAPSPFYDPLSFLTEEAHKRCMEVHAWINPYRVTTNESTGKLAKEHLIFREPRLFTAYGGKYLFDPGLPETRDHLVKVVADIVSRYDIDAVHFDDYFYPYRVAGKDFPDRETFQNYSRGFTDKNEWRRDNVNLVIARLQDTIKAIKPWVELGISPFGVWRNDTEDLRGSATRTSCTNYDELYADILKWLEEGWIDYVVPQLYWEIDKKTADYAVLASWWSEHTYGKKLYIGLYVSGLEENKEKAWKTPNEIVRQLCYNQDCSEIEGVLFYSSRYLLKNIQGLKDSLRNNFYRYPALLPENGYIPEKDRDLSTPQNVKITDNSRSRLLSWNKVEGEGGLETAYYVVYGFPADEKEPDFTNPEHILTLTTDNQLDLTDYPQTYSENYTLAVTAVNRYKQESKPTLLFVNN